MGLRQDPLVCLGSIPMETKGVRRYEQLGSQNLDPTNTVDVGSGVSVPASQRVRLRDRGVVVELDLAFDETEGRAMVERVEVTREKDGPSVTGALLRRLPISSYITNAVKS